MSSGCAVSWFFTAVVTLGIRGADEVRAFLGYLAAELKVAASTHTVR